MDKKSDIETILQNTVDELFALHKQVKADHQQFLVDSATLLKASDKQVTESTQAAIFAEKAAQESSEAAKQVSSVAHHARDHLKMWQRAVFWFAVGFWVIGASLGLMYFILGKQVKHRQYQLEVLQMRYDVMDSALKENQLQNSAR